MTSTEIEIETKIEFIDLPDYVVQMIMDGISFDTWLSVRQTCKRLYELCHEKNVCRLLCLRSSCYVKGPTTSLIHLAQHKNPDALFVCAHHCFAHDNMVQAFELFEQYFVLQKEQKEESESIYASPDAVSPYWDNGSIIVLYAHCISYKNESVGVITYVHIEHCYHLRMMFVPLESYCWGKRDCVKKRKTFYNPMDLTPPYSKVSDEWILDALQTFKEKNPVDNSNAVLLFEREVHMCTSSLSSNPYSVSLSSTQSHTPFDYLRITTSLSPVHINTSVCPIHVRTGQQMQQNQDTPPITLCSFTTPHRSESENESDGGELEVPFPPQHHTESEPDIYEY